MESDELRAASARIGSSSVWRSSGVDVFSGSSRRDDDEEELKWAAIEKLPTYLRMTRGILTEAEGQPPTEIDINKLCPLQRKNLVERLVKIAEQDNEKFLFKLRDRIDRVGLEIPTIEVRFEHLNVEAEAHVGSRALPTIFNFCINLLEGFLSSLHLIPSRKKPFTVLDGVSGIIKPRRMTLLLGPPSSGKTTLLLALAGRLGKDLKFSGRVSYNGRGMEEFVPQRTSAYISQSDLHIGEMTVRETLAFSARCQGIGTRYEMLAELSRREKAENIKPDPDLDIYMKVPPNSTEPLGVKVLKSRGIFPEAYWYWIGVGASIGYMALFNFLFPLALHYLDPFGKPQALISEEALAERNAGRNEHIVELSSRHNGSSGGLHVHSRGHILFLF
ncbi:hypothetical protein ACSQ67_018768 [Phaseolus vulgaris]